MVLLCNRNQELRHTGYLQQLIIFPLIIASGFGCSPEVVCAFMAKKFNKYNKEY